MTIENVVAQLTKLPTHDGKQTKQNPRPKPKTTKVLALKGLENLLNDSVQAKTYRITEILTRNIGYFAETLNSLNQENNADHKKRNVTTYGHSGLNKKLEITESDDETTYTITNDLSKIEETLTFSDNAYPNTTTVTYTKKDELNTTEHNISISPTKTTVSTKTTDSKKRVYSNEIVISTSREETEVYLKRPGKPSVWEFFLGIKPTINARYTQAQQGKHVLAGTTSGDYDVRTNATLQNGEVGTNSQPEDVPITITFDQILRQTLRNMQHPKQTYDLNQ